MTFPHAEIVFDPFSECMTWDPYPVYQQLRDTAPVYYNPASGFWALSRYSDVQAASRDWPAFTSARGVDPDHRGRILSINSLLEEDPPRHDILRKVLRHHFTPRGVQSLASPIDELVRGLVAEVAQKRVADLSKAVAYRLPLLTICKLLGLPVSDEPDLASYMEMLLSREPDGSRLPAAAYEGERLLKGYLHQATLSRRRRLGSDVLSTIARAEMDGVMKHQEALSMAAFLFFAGSETAGSLMSNFAYLLATQPEKRAWLDEHLDALPSAIEEVLRYESPVQHLTRVTTRDVELAGTTVPSGSRVFLLYASANRDERQFDRPDELDFERPRFRHLAFGEGVHFCLGAPLARLEGRLALGALLRSLPPWRLAGEIQRAPLAETRGVSRLVVEW
jgi:cytochrome P450